MPDPRHPDRRRVLVASATLVAAPWLMTRSGLAGQSTSANDTIGIGVIQLQRDIIVIAVAITGGVTIHVRVC